MQLVQTLTRQLGGTLNIQRQPGASFILNLHEVLPRERAAS
jgi:two-component sensor histidine kinase